MLRDAPDGLVGATPLLARPGDLSQLTVNATAGSRPRKAVAHKPFDICSAGLYDNELLEDLDFPDYESFCLELFGCQPGLSRVAGVPFSGTRKGDPVHFFPWKETELGMGLEYIQSLHERVKKKLTGTMYVVAPDSRCDPGLFVSLVKFQRLTVFILRVPYSVIEALHDREFRLIDQPAKLSDVNDALDAYGFDFVQPPEVEAKFWRSAGYVRGRVDSFMRGGLDPDDFDEQPEAGRNDLAMVMLDPKYNGNWFNLHHHYEGTGKQKVLVSHHCFGQDLAEAEWEFSLPASVFGDEFMVIYVDTHGNERAETISVADLPGRRPRSRAAAKPHKQKPIKASANRTKTIRGTKRTKTSTTRDPRRSSNGVVPKKTKPVRKGVGTTTRTKRRPASTKSA